MNYSKFISKLFTKNNTSTQVTLAAVAGVAVGAVIAVLFAPASGSVLRKTITNRAKGLFGNTNQFKENELLAPSSSKTPVPVKKPKSDIKELSHKTHGEQS